MQSIIIAPTPTGALGRARKRLAFERDEPARRDRRRRFRRALAVVEGVPIEPLVLCNAGVEAAL